MRKKTKRRRLNKAATKKLKRRQQNKVATTKTKAVTTNKVARKKNKASTKNKASQQNKFILQCNFIYLECLLLFFFWSIVITYSLYIILKKCSYIFMIFCLISKSTWNKFIIIIIIIRRITIIILIIIICTKVLQW